MKICTTLKKVYCQQNSSQDLSSTGNKMQPNMYTATVVTKNFTAAAKMSHHIIVTRWYNGMDIHYMYSLQSIDLKYVLPKQKYQDQ